MTITWVGLPLLVGAAVVIRGCAQIERVRTLLSPYVDPLAAAKRMLVEPGPLTP